MPEPDYRITLRPAPGHATPGIVRLRKALKCLLRSYGLRCIYIAASDPPAVTDADKQPGTTQPQQ